MHSSLLFPSRFSLNNRSDSFSTFVVVWFCRSFMRCQRCTTRVTVSLDVRRQHVESSWLRLRNSVHYNPWQWTSSSSFIRCNFLCQFQLMSYQLPRRATQGIPVRSIPCIVQWLSRPTFASHNSTLGDSHNCSCSTMMTTKDSLSHVALQVNWTPHSPILRNETFPPYCVTGFPIFVQFVSVRLSLHLVAHSLRGRCVRPFVYC